MTAENKSRKIRHLLILEDLDGSRLIPLEESSYFLGSDAINSIVVRSQGISRQHALFLRVTNADPNSYGFMLIDGNLQGESSTNGTCINGEKCVSSKLSHGDHIEFGCQMKAKYLIPGSLTDLEFADFCQNFDFEDVDTRDVNPRETFVHQSGDLPSFGATSLVRLASFPEILPSPVFEINLKGDLTYINPAAYNAFADLPHLCTQHPIVRGLIALTQSSKQKILSREVTVDHKVYEQSIHFISENGLIRCSLSDITERKQVEAELFKRDCLLQSVAEAATHLLANVSGKDAIEIALARYGATAGVDRICISENQVHAETNRLTTTIRFEWTGTSIPSIRHFEHRHHQLYSNPHLQRWYTTLAGGAAINGLTHHFPPAENTLFAQEGVQSLLAVPILVNNNFWGFIELHDCTDQYRWSDQEEAILRTMAASVSAALERQDKDEVIYSHLKKLEKVTEYVGSNLIGKDFSNKDLEGKDFTNADLSSAKLLHANLKLVIAIATNFTEANFTGACIQDWNINTETKFDNVICDYIYLKCDRSERRPQSGNFGPGEFATLVQKSLETIDLIFIDGIDWLAFFKSFQKLRSQFDDQEIDIQAIEKKGEAFVVRLETSLPEANKAAIEERAKELYEQQSLLLERHYEEKLKLQNFHLEDARRAIYNEKKEKATLIGVMSTMAENQQGPTYNMQSSKFGGGFATDGGTQTGGSLTDKSINIQNNEEIANLISNLREQVYSFSLEQQEIALGELEDLEDELQNPENIKPKRIGRRLKGLLAAGAATATFAGTAATGAVDFSKKANDFTGNVLELATKLGIELVQDKQQDK